MIPLDDEPGRSCSETIARVKRWVVAACELDDLTPVLVTELRCLEEGCPPVETLVAILPEAGRRWQHRFHKPASAVAWHEVIHLGTLWDEWAASVGLHARRPR